MTGPARGGSRAGGALDGVAVIDKPAGWTSHDVVARARKALGTRRVGHSGTLDPDATGVLVLGVGRATRLLRFLTVLPKVYEAEMVLGVETDTLDASGSVTARHDMSAVTGSQVRAAAAALTGDIGQVPPMVSALKVGGRRLHELARAGIEVERPPRPVTVSRFEVEPVPGQAGVWRAVIECSAGTYVRVLAADLGLALGGGAHVGALRRTAVGGFGLGDAVALESLEPPALLPMSAAVRHLAGVRVGDGVAAQVRHGRVLELQALGVPGTAAADPTAVDDGRAGTAAADPTAGGPWAVHGADGALLAVYEAFGERAKPAVVVVG